MEHGKDRETLQEHILAESPGKRLTCRKAFEIAGETGCSLADLGKLCNELGIKIVGCQLGCF